VCALNVAWLMPSFPARNRADRHAAADQADPDRARGVRHLGLIGGTDCMGSSPTAPPSQPPGRPMASWCPVEGVASRPAEDEENLSPLRPASSLLSASLARDCPGCDLWPLLFLPIDPSDCATATGMACACTTPATAGHMTGIACHPKSVMTPLRSPCRPCRPYRRLPRASADPSSPAARRPSPRW